MGITLKILEKLKKFSKKKSIDLIKSPPVLNWQGVNYETNVYYNRKRKKQSWEDETHSQCKFW